MLRPSLMCLLVIGWVLFSSSIAAICGPYPCGGILLVAYLLLHLSGALFICVDSLHGLHGFLWRTSSCMFLNSACGFLAQVSPALCFINPFVL